MSKTFNITTLLLMIMIPVSALLYLWHEDMIYHRTHHFEYISLSGERGKAKHCKPTKTYLRCDGNIVRGYIEFRDVRSD